VLPRGGGTSQSGNGEFLAGGRLLETLTSSQLDTRQDAARSSPASCSMTSPLAQALWPLVSVDVSTACAPPSAA